MIAVMISLSTEEFLLVDERIQVVTVTVRFAKCVSYVFDGLFGCAANI